MQPNLRLDDHNDSRHADHQFRWGFLQELLDRRGLDANALLRSVRQFQVAIPSWALGTGGTRFGRYAGGGEPRSLEEKIDDVGLLHALNRASGAISLHIPWDIPKDADAIKQQLQSYDLTIDSVNSNTFQDQPQQAHSYKFGSLCHTDAAVRQQAVEHNLDVVHYGKQLGSKVLTVWLADGSNFPGQHHFRRAYERTQESLQSIYAGIPADWTMLIEYKPYEPHFYSMLIPDWGTSLRLSEACGPNAHVLVDLGHHLPNTNIEQIVARLLHFGRLGGFHFNGSAYGDDDLTTGSTRPFQLFLIFCELVQAAQDRVAQDKMLRNPPVAYMIDASHNTKDPLEDLLQSVQNILTAYAKALLVDTDALFTAQQENDVVAAEELLRDAFQTDVRPLVAEAMLQNGGALDPLGLYRQLNIRQQRIEQRGKLAVATGL